MRGFGFFLSCPLSVTFSAGPPSAVVVLGKKVLAAYSVVHFTPCDSSSRSTLNPRLLSSLHTRTCRCERRHFPRDFPEAPPPLSSSTSPSSPSSSEMLWFRQGLCVLPAFLVVWSSCTFIVSYLIAILRRDVDVVFPYIR